MKKSLFFLAAASMALASCSNEDVIEETRHGDGIDFRASIAQGATSRGTETTQATLSQFYVTAMYGNLEWFGQVLFTKSGSANLYVSEEDYLWPGHGALDFYAWSYNSGTDGLAPNPLDSKKIGDVYIDNLTQTLTFTPQQNVPDQIDLVTAFKTASKADVREDGIGLEFNHALCEISVLAKSANADYNFSVHGIAIGSVNKSGVLALKPIASALDDDPATEPNSPWSFPTSEKTDYVVLLDEPITLTSSATEISNATKSSVGYVMPIPQNLSGWDHVGDPTNSQGGAYLAVLVRIVNKDTNQDAYPRRAAEGEHRVGESDDVKGYGWACVPISSNWQPGFRYVYTLDFSYGAGQFPPKDPDQPGEDILGGPIKFNVTMTDWANATDVNVNMNGHDTDEQSDAGNTPLD